MDFQAEKQLVLDFYAALDRPQASEAALGQYLAPDVLWRGYHPFNEIRDLGQVASTSGILSRRH